MATKFELICGEEIRDEVLKFLKKRLWNYPVIDETSFGFRIVSLDDTGLFVPNNESAPAWVLSDGYQLNGLGRC